VNPSQAPCHHRPWLRATKVCSSVGQILTFERSSWYWYLVSLLGTFSNFHTSLLLLWGPRLIFGWYQADIYKYICGFETCIKQVEGSGISSSTHQTTTGIKAGIASALTRLLGSFLPVLIPGTVSL
jgi:hypothetical protein